MKKKTRLPKLPSLLDRKIYKTGQTRGADDDVIYQNRVSRTSTALIPYGSWSAAFPIPDDGFENGFILLLRPDEFFGTGASVADRERALAENGVRLGDNALVFYQRRVDWVSFPPDSLNWDVATSRTAPLGGKYVARIAATTSDQVPRVNRGFTSTSSKGAGIRVYEYAPASTIADCRTQLEALFWMAEGSEDVCAEFGMEPSGASLRKKSTLEKAEKEGLLDLKKMRDARVIDGADHPACPLCRTKLDPRGFFNRLVQAEGREVHDLTVTELNLFHIRELRVGEYNHRPYNLGWGCHHCNVVTKDSGVQGTLDWMAAVLARNKAC